MGHMLAPEPTTEAGAVQSQRMRVSARSLFSDEAGSGAKGRVAASDPSWMARGGGVQSLWTHASAGALLGGGEGSEALETW
jgi:hypothetical protein